MSRDQTDRTWETWMRGPVTRLARIRARVNGVPGPVQDVVDTAEGLFREDPERRRFPTYLVTEVIAIIGRGFSRREEPYDEPRTQQGREVCAASGRDPRADHRETIPGLFTAAELHSDLFVSELRNLHETTRIRLASAVPLPEREELCHLLDVSEDLVRQFDKTHPPSSDKRYQAVSRARRIGREVMKNAAKRAGIILPRYLRGAGILLLSLVLGMAPTPDPGPAESVSQGMRSHELRELCHFDDTDAASPEAHELASLEGTHDASHELRIRERPSRSQFRSHELREMT